ncbi:MAG: GHKL domain-containing protein [Eubacteriales bacterium]|nr:GHKL domain-containing protein [Eubacteriales bacterium]
MSFYFRHAAGFFLQLAPCGVLCFLPFSEGVFRWPKRRTMGAVTLCELLLALLFPLVLRATRFQQLTGNLYMLGAVLLLAAAYFRLLRDASAKKLLVLFLVMFYALTQYCAVILALPLVNGGVFSSEMYTLRCLLLWAVTTAVMFPVGVLVSLKIVRDYLAEIAPEHMGRDFVWVMFFTVAYFALIIRYNTLIDYSRPDQIILFAPLLLLLFWQQGLAWWLLLRESVRRRRDAEQQKALEIQQLQYDNLTREMENARRMRHDMRHYLNGLADLMEQGKTAEMKKYLSEVIGQTASRENTVYCKNPTVNGLLQYYAGLAAEAGIRCEIQANCGELSISPADLTVLFGNAMENAIRACKAFSEGRWLRVQAGVIGGSLAIQIENPCAGAPPSGLYRLEDGFLPAAAFLSVRSGGGYGLRSIEHTAGKYGGDARFRYDETTHIFTIRIRLNLYPDALK